jgi:hypothetical protein
MPAGAIMKNLTPEEQKRAKKLKIGKFEVISDAFGKRAVLTTTDHGKEVTTSLWLPTDEMPLGAVSCTAKYCNTGTNECYHHPLVVSEVEKRGVPKAQILNLEA